jgi:hypothetical protein
MTKSEANQLLDKLKDGAKLSYADTRTALTVTGDYEEFGGEGVDCQVQEETERPWECPSIRMVATSLVRHREKAWVTRR